MRWCILFFVVFASPLLAEIKVDRVEQDSGQLIRVDYGADDRVGVIAVSDGAKVDLESFDRYESDSAGNLTATTGRMVFTGLPGKYQVVGWEGRNFFSRAVEFKGSVAPGPDPNPDPNPDPTPEPGNVVDMFGYGRIAYSEAVRTGDKVGAAIIADVWDRSARTLYAGKTDIPGAVKYIETQSNARLPVDSRARWGPWASAMEELFRSKKLADTDVLGHVRAFDEVAKAVGVYAK